VFDLTKFEKAIENNVLTALAEDLGSEDLTHAFKLDLTVSLLDAQKQSEARIITREKMVLSGRPWVEKTFETLSKQTQTPLVEINWKAKDGDALEADAVICTLKGPVQTLLTGERTALNFLQTLSATATQTANTATLITSYATKLLDTRKTLPGLRIAQKYAVSCGGGCNHRIGLYDAFLIKENHIAAAGSIEAAVNNAKTINPNVKLEVEVETVDELNEAFKTPCDVIMLDNFALKDIEYAVSNKPKHVALEVSGNVDNVSIMSYAQTGVDYISMGALTKHINAIDLSFRLID